MLCIWQGQFNKITAIYNYKSAHSYLKKMPEYSKKFRFDNLDSIRTIAFLATFITHAFHAESEKSIALFALKIQEYFAFGVPIFFVLSGFLITFLMLKEQENNGKFNLKNFYVRRVLRIWPVYFLVLIVGFMLFPLLRNTVLHAPYVENANPYYYISFLSNFDQINNLTLPFGIGLGPTWSVSIEEQFYLFWPIFILIFKRTKFIYVIVSVLLISIVTSILFDLSNKHTLFCMIYLSIGGIYGYLSYYRKDTIDRLVNISKSLFLIIITILFILIYASTIGIGDVTLIILIAFIIGYVIVFQCFSGKLQLKRVPFFERLGKYTYGLYLYHSICIFCVHIVIDDILQIPESAFSVLLIKPILSFSLSLIFSIYSYNYFEKFFLNLKTKFDSTKKSN